MKINKKLAFGGIKSLSFGAYKPVIKSDFQKVEKATSDKPVLFYIFTAHSYPVGKEDDEKGGLKGPLIVFGKPDKEWKTEIKAKTKSNKKETLTGKCFVTTDDKGGKVLNAYVTAGGIPTPKLKTAAKKLFNHLGITEFIELGTISDEMLEASLEEETPEDSTEETLEPEVTTPVSEEKALFLLIEQFKAVMPTVKPLLATVLAGKPLDAKGKASVDAVVANIRSFKEHYQKATPDIQAKFQAALPQMDKILAIASGTGSKEDIGAVNESSKAAEALNKALEQAQKILASMDLEKMALNG